MRIEFGSQVARLSAGSRLGSLPGCPVEPSARLSHKGTRPGIMFGNRWCPIGTAARLATCPKESAAGPLLFGVIARLVAAPGCQIQTQGAGRPIGIIARLPDWSCPIGAQFLTSTQKVRF